MSSTNRGAKRHADDFYTTPAWATRAILPRLGEPETILEPAAGAGAIVTECRRQWPTATIGAIEIDPDRAASCGAAVGDFLKPGSASQGWDLLITNPPFKLAMEFIRHALPMASTVAMLLRLNFLGSQKRAPFWRQHPCGVYILPKRPSFTGGATDSCEYAWFVWGEAHTSRWDVLEIAA